MSEFSRQLIKVHKWYWKQKTKQSLKISKLTKQIEITKNMKNYLFLVPFQKLNKRLNFHSLNFTLQ